LSFLLDTNVVSEATRRTPNTTVQTWLAAQAPESLYLSAITIGEVRYGTVLLDAGRKRRALLHWLEELKTTFAGRILAVDTPVMEQWAEIEAASTKAGRRLPVMDALIAATALTYDLTLATRNTEDFQSIRLSLINPWRS
jgi:predicted nucleic acid-binding protein